MMEMLLMEMAAKDDAAIVNTNMWEAYNNHHNEKNNIQSISELLNSAIEELVKIYIWW